MTAASRRGFTLLESVIAGALFLIAGLMAYSVLKYAMLAHNRGVLGTDAQRAVRELTTRLTSDLQAAMALQLPTATSQEAVPSAVIMPSSARANAEDDLAFTAPAKQEVAGLDPSQATSYVLVRYARRLHDLKSPSSPPTAVYRRSYPYNLVAEFVKYGADPKESVRSDAWYLDVAALDARYGAPGDSTRLADNGASAVKDTGWQEIISFAGPNDLVKFALSHPSVPGASGVPLYDPYHFTIWVKAVRYVATPRFVVADVGANESLDQKNDRAVKDLSTEVTLQRFQ